jgi:septal ring factor EnvC (AmiA/AmiB activator)
MRAVAAIVCVLGAVLTFLGINATVEASNINQLRNDRTQISANVSQARAQLNATIAARRNLEFEINRLDLEIQWAHEAYEHYTELYEWAVRELNILEADLSIAQLEYDAQYERFAERMRELNETDTFGLGYLQVFLSASSITDALNNAEMISSLAEHDKNLTDQLRSKRHYLSWKLEEVELFREEFELLCIDQANMILEQEALETEKKAMLEQLEADEAKFREIVSDLQRDEDSIAAQISAWEAQERARQAANNPYVGGEMLWPVPGYSHISSHYGQRRHPITKRQHHHNGVDIPASRGVSIVAANDGKVIYSGRNSSYGNYVIIDHGGGTTTIYAHNSSNIVSAGDSVTKGQVIAKIGSTGSSTGNHLHFEVRINNVPQNPVDYLKPR